MPADLIQCDKAVVAIKSRVLEPLRHHRAAILVHGHRKADDGLPTEAAARLGHEVCREEPVQKLKDARIQICPVGPRVRQRPVDIAPVRFARLGSTVYVSAVHRKARNNLLQCALQDIAREVSGPRVLSRNTTRVAGEYVEFARHFIEHDADLAVADDLVEGAMLASKISVSLGKAFFAGGVDQQSEHQIGEFVAGSALDRPVLAQCLVAREDLFDHEVEGGGSLFTKAQQIALRVEQPIYVVDAQPIQHSIAQQLEHESVSVLEELRQFHTQAYELVDIQRVSQTINRQLVSTAGQTATSAGLWVETEHELSRFQHRPVLVAE